jgi:hypothetical protein
MKRFLLFAGILLSPFFFLAATTQIDWTTQVKNKPTFATVATTGAYSDLTGQPSLWNDPGAGTLLKRTGAFTFAAAVSNTDYQAALGFTPENSANKGAASGYAGLVSSKVPVANLPSCVASGASHASGLVPDPGASAGTTKFLREDCTFVAPSSKIYQVDHFQPTSCSAGATSYFVNFSSPATNPATPICRAGSNIIGGYITYNATTLTSQILEVIPADWDTGTNPYIRLNIAQGNANTGQTITMTAAVSCSTGADDGTFQTAQSFPNITTNATNLQQWSTSLQFNSTSMTNCAAGGTMFIKIGVSSIGTNFAYVQMATVTMPRLNTNQAN